MHILITGGTGFLGSNLIKRHQDDQFTVLARDIERAKKSLGEQHHYVTSITDIPLETRFDVIINLSGEPIADKKWSEERKKALQQSRWQITRDLVDWIKATKYKPGCFLSGSAIGFYGTSDTATFTENDIPETEDFSSHLCRVWEDIAMRVSDITRVVLLRTGIVLSPDGGVLKKMLLPFKLGFGGKLGSGEQWMSWIHINDYCHALEWLISNKNCRGPYNLTAPNPVKNSEFSTLLARSIRRPAIFSVPAFLLNMALGEAATLVLDGQKVMPQKLGDNNFTFSFVNFSEAINDLLLT